MEHTSRPQPLVITKVFASLAPTMCSNMYSFGRHDNTRRTGLLIGWPLASPAREVGHVRNAKSP
jgi:hypothetical protein